MNASAEHPGHEDRIVYLANPAPDVELRFHLDENVGVEVAAALRDKGFNVTTTNDVGLRAQPDDSQMAFAREQRRVLLTRDRDFLALHRQQVPHCGIIYWPHGRVTTPEEMQSLLLCLLVQIVESPDRPAVLAPEGTAGSSGQARSQSRREASCRSGTESRELPAGTRVTGVVEAICDEEVLVRLSDRHAAYLLPHRLPPTRLQVGDEIEGVTVQYLKAQRKLQLSMRRNFTMTRTMPTKGLRQLRLDNHRLIHHIQSQWPVEIVVERDHRVRLFGFTSDALRDAAQQLSRDIPWMASAVIFADRVTFKEWMIPAYGGLMKMAASTGTELHYLHRHHLLICAESNRQLSHILDMIQARVPGMEMCQMQRAQAEALRKCVWPSLESEVGFSEPDAADLDAAEPGSGPSESHS